MSTVLVVQESVRHRAMKLCGEYHNLFALIFFVQKLKDERINISMERVSDIARALMPQALILFLPSNSSTT
jgi:hypothetical protein